jgi:hypothetical protein
MTDLDYKTEAWLRDVFGECVTRECHVDVFPREDDEVETWVHGPKGGDLQQFRVSTRGLRDQHTAELKAWVQEQHAGGTDAEDD